MFRIPPLMPAGSYKTYGLAAPLATHFRVATCAEVGCRRQDLGWKSPIDESTDLGQKQAHYIRKLSGRSHTEQRTEAGLTMFTFAAGQTCFSQHQVPQDRPTIFSVRDGDWRGNPRGTPTLIHRPDDWLDDFADHQQKLADRLRQG